MNVVILTGAGISAESGIPTFRDADGLWENHSIMEVATPEGFQKDPELVHRFYNLRRQAAAAVQPNAAHLALADLERAWPAGKFAIITQNIDPLHERGGSQTVLHMHGHINEIRCTACGTVHRDWQTDCVPATPCPSCQVPSLRPNVVWFGEMPVHLDDIEVALNNCDVFAAIGTSGSVYPAAGFIDAVAARGAETWVINLAPSPDVGHLHGFNDSDMQPPQSNIELIGPATVKVPEWVDLMKARLL